MRRITAIIVHCADTYASMDVGVKEIRKWHTDPPPKGRGWSDIGYHYVIRRSGIVEPGRRLEVAGAHVAGHNVNSVGVCLVGGKPAYNFEPEQIDSLRALIETLLKRFPNAEVIGHRDLDKSKECPTFDVRTWWRQRPV